jgi:uncharacterized protein (TIGR03435 family)
MRICTVYDGFVVSVFRSANSVALILSTSVLVLSQSGAPSTFEVASVKQNTGDPEGSRSSAWVNGRFTSINLPLKQYIAWAYNIREDQISGPGWLSSQRFDITAKTAVPPALGEKLGPFLQGLLIDRFTLTTHWELREVPAYALVIDRGGNKLTVAESENRGISIRGNTWTATTSMAQFANQLSRRVGRPVIDQTGLQGAYTFKFVWDPATTQAPSVDTIPDSQGPSIFAALRQQLGLRLESNRSPIQILVIDHIERALTGN